MTTLTRQKLNLAVIATDRTFELEPDRQNPRVKYWVGKCIHCNTRVTLTESGEPLSATLEHIVPSSQGGTDDVSNLAFACASCNHTKGRTVDKFHKDHPAFQEMVRFLFEKKRNRTPKRQKKV